MVTIVLGTHLGKRDFLSPERSRRPIEGRCYRCLQILRFIQIDRCTFDIEEEGLRPFGTVELLFPGAVVHLQPDIRQAFTFWRVVDVNVRRNRRNCRIVLQEGNQVFV